MSKTKNEIVGRVPCPLTGCGQSCDVRKFANRAAPGRATRYAGLLYFDCPAHGRFGNDGRPAMQDYILEHGEIFGATRPAAAAPSPADPPAAAPAPSKPETVRPAASAPAARPAASRRSAGLLIE